MGTTIYSQIKADDVDAGVNGLVEYFLIEGPKNATGQQAHSLTTADGFGVFAIAYPHQGHVSILLNYYHHSFKTQISDIDNRSIEN